MVEKADEVTDIVVAAPGEVSLSQIFHERMIFTTEAELNESADIANARLLGWSTGNQEYFDSTGKKSLGMARGFFLNKPDEDELLPDDFALMDAMDILVERGQAVECVVARNDEKTGASRRVPSWHLPVASLFVVCRGIPTKPQMKDPAYRRGVAYSGWSAGAKSFVSFYAFVQELMDAGYNGVFRLKFSSYITDKALDCLKAQEYVLRLVKTWRAKAGIDTPIAWYAYSLSVQCSSKTLTAGKEAGKTKEVHYPIPVIPRLNNAQAAAAYLASHAITENQAMILEDGGRVDAVCEWSVKASQGNAGDADFYNGDDDASDTGTYEPVDIDGKPIKAPF